MALIHDQKMSIGNHYKSRFDPIFILHKIMHFIWILVYFCIFPPGGAISLNCSEISHTTTCQLNVSLLILGCV